MERIWFELFAAQATTTTATSTVGMDKEYATCVAIVAAKECQGDSTIWFYYLNGTRGQDATAIDWKEEGEGVHVVIG